MADKSKPTVSHSDEEDETFTGLDSFYQLKTAHLWARQSYEDDDADMVDQRHGSVAGRSFTARERVMANPFEDPFIAPMKASSQVHRTAENPELMLDDLSNSQNSIAERETLELRQSEEFENEETYQELATTVIESETRDRPLRTSAGPTLGGKSVIIRRALSSYRKRVVVLLLLFILQSASSEILQRYEKLISNHIIITLFLTCLVGAGGNAGSQAVISMLSHMTSHQVTKKKLWHSLKTELVIGSLLASTLAILGFCRAWYTIGDLNTHILEVLAIAISLFANVLLSVLIGTALPYLLSLAKLDPVHASPIIQVTMDILGVIVTCNVCSIILS